MAGGEGAEVSRGSATRKAAKWFRSINKVTLLGNVGSVPKTRTFNDGASSVTMFPVATNQYFTTKQGERVKKTQWHNIVVFNERLAGVASKFIKPGSIVYIEGALNTRSYTDASGATKSIVEVVLSNFHSELAVLSFPGDTSEDSALEEEHKEEAPPS